MVVSATITTAGGDEDKYGRTKGGRSFELEGLLGVTSSSVESGNINLFHGATTHNTRRPSMSATVSRCCGWLKLFFRRNPILYLITLLFCVSFVVLRPALQRRMTKRKKYVYIPPHLKAHFGDVVSYYELQASKVDHWCIHGGDDNCKCNDPTQELDRYRQQGWKASLEYNMNILETSPPLDVVFLGDEKVQAWTGRKLKDKIVGGSRLDAIFRTLFFKENGGAINGRALGIAGDSTANLLYRVHHGELPDWLESKTYWLHIGTNDLVNGECSEEAVILGILRLADEIAQKKPNSKVVIQGLLPRSPFPDGSLKRGAPAIRKDPSKKQIRPKVHHTLPVLEDKTKSGKSKEYFQQQQYPMWPSIQVINSELEKFCETHAQMIYFDASDVFIGSTGNTYYTQHEQILLKDLMPDFKQPSIQGHELWLQVLEQALENIIFFDMDDNINLGTGESLAHDKMPIPGVTDDEKLDDTSGT